MFFFFCLDDKQIYVVNGTGNSAQSDENESIPSGSSSSCSSTSMFDDFQGVSLLRTTCLECEFVTERKESFCDICVPINGLSNGDISPENDFNPYGLFLKMFVKLAECMFTFMNCCFRL